MVVAIPTGMEKIAITIWNGIISPVYDVACHINIYCGIQRLEEFDVRTATLSDKALLCSDEQVQTVLCGAISSVALQLLLDRKIKVVPWICGPVIKIATAYYDGLDVRRLYAMPGIPCRPRGAGKNCCRRAGYKKVTNRGG